MATREVSGAPPRATRSLQFSLRTLFIVMTVLAVICSAIFACPGWVGILAAVFLVITVPMVLTVMVIYGCGYLRTFCIGALFPAGLLLFSAGPLMPYGLYGWASLFGEWDNDSEEFRIYLGIGVLVAFAVIVTMGIIAVGVRWVLDASRRAPPAVTTASDPSPPAASGGT